MEEKAERCGGEIRDKREKAGLKRGRRSTDFLICRKKKKFHEQVFEIAKNRGKYPKNSI